MKPIVVAGVALGLVVNVFAILQAAAGPHRNPLVSSLLFIAVAIVLNIGAVIWCLRQTRMERGYAGQVGAGLLVGLIASVFIFCGSMLLTTVLFPDYLHQMVDGWAERMQDAPLPQDQIDAQIEVMRAAATPLASALQGVWGTLGTSLLISLVTAIFLRRK